jgi:hypothetical protein
MSLSQEYLTASHRCRFCGRTIYEFRDHLPRCPALGWYFMRAAGRESGAPTDAKVGGQETPSTARTGSGARSAQRPGPEPPSAAKPAARECPDLPGHETHTPPCGTFARRHPETEDGCGT